MSEISVKPISAKERAKDIALRITRHENAIVIFVLVADRRAGSYNKWDSNPAN